MQCLSAGSASMQVQARATARAVQQPIAAAPRSISVGRTPQGLASSSGRVLGLRARPLAALRPRAPKQQQLAVCSLTSHPGEEQSSTGDLLPSYTIPSTGMAKGLGSSGNSATLQRSKLSNKQSSAVTGPKLDDGMGGGGIGKGIFNGGGGDGGDGDDDDYFNEFGDGDGDGSGDNSFFRTVLGELYDPKAINAVLQEWFKTMADMPLILRQAASMGLFSSAALVRFLAMDVRPGVTRFVTRSMPPAVSREVVGRLMADPAFMQKLMLEQMITISSALVYEGKVRGDRFWKELDLVATNVLCLSAANAALVYMVAPTRAATPPGRFEWQNMLGKLPNNVFEATTPMRTYTTGSRAAAFFTKSAELCGVGMLAGAAQSSLSHAAVALRRKADPSFQPSMPIPSVQQSALGFAAAHGIFANLRYQMVAGIDRYLFDHASFLWSYLAASGAFRTVSTVLGDQTRRYLQGLPNGDAVMAQRARHQAAYRAWAAQQAAAARRSGNVVVRSSETAPAPAAAASGSSSSSSSAGKKKRRSTKKAAGGFEMGVGPAPAPMAA